MNNETKAAIENIICNLRKEARLNDQVVKNMYATCGSAAVLMHAQETAAFARKYANQLSNVLADAAVAVDPNPTPARGVTIVTIETGELAPDFDPYDG